MQHKEENAISVLLLYILFVEQHHLIVEVELFILGGISSVLNKNDSCCKETTLFLDKIR